MEIIELDIRGKDVGVFALPHISSEELFQTQLARLCSPGEQKDERSALNIAVLHGSLVGLPRHFTTGQFNELSISGQIMDAGFDYVALGHYHERTIVSPNCAYSGSTERFSFGETGQTKGFIEVTLGIGSCEMKYRDLGTRRMLDLGGLNAHRLGINELMENISLKIQEVSLEGAIARLKIFNLTKDVYDHMDFNLLERSTREALYFQFNWTFSDQDDMSGDYSAQFKGLLAEFQQFIDDTIVEDLDKEKLKELGLDYLIRAGATE